MIPSPRQHHRNIDGERERHRAKNNDNQQHVTHVLALTLFMYSVMCSRFRRSSSAFHFWLTSYASERTISFRVIFFAPCVLPPDHPAAVKAILRLCKIVE